MMEIVTSLDKGFVVIAEVVIGLLISRSKGWGRKYSASVAGYAGFLLTTSKLVSLGYIPVQYIDEIVIFGVIGMFVIYLVATNFKIRVGSGSDIWKNIASLGTFLAIICPIIYALIV